MPQLQPPPERTYDSFIELITDINSFAKTQGYAVVKRRTKKRKPTDESFSKAVLVCDRGGVEYKDTAQTRVTRTRKVDCPWTCNAVLSQSSGLWEFKHRSTEHSHPASIRAGAHPTHRKLSTVVANTIAEQSASNIRARDIVTNLRLNNEDLEISHKDVYNERYKLRQLQLGLYSPIQALLHEFQSSEIQHQVQFVRDTQQIQALFFCLPWGQEMCKTNADVLLIDTTYKTNRFKMPLVNFCGVTCLGSTFNAGFCFISAEDEATYTWTFEQFSTQVAQLKKPGVILFDGDKSIRKACEIIFPEAQIQLCIWHINQNVLGMAKKTWKTNNSEQDNERIENFMKQWSILLFAKNQSAFYDQWDKIKSSQGFDFIEYLEKEIWPKRFKWASCYVNHNRHFGHRVTSRVESSHAEIKSYIGNSRGDLKSVVDGIKLMTLNKSKEWQIRLTQASTRISTAEKIPLLAQLRGKVSPIALNHILHQRSAISKSNFRETCTKNFRDSMGLPCAHEIQRKQLRNEIIRLNEVDPHWYFEREQSQITQEIDPLLLIENPSVVRTKGRPRGAGNIRIPEREREDTSTRRESSWWER